MMRCCFITLGCRVNQYESDAMAELLTQAGFEITENPAEADVCIVNTCTVTNIADRKSRQMLSKAHKLNPNAKLIAAGEARKRRQNWRVFTLCSEVRTRTALSNL